MSSQKYSVNQHLIETLLTWVKSGEIAIPEIQRPFVWDASKVRDLMDSLYQGYPVGYIIAWRNPNIKLKNSRDTHSTSGSIISQTQAQFLELYLPIHQQGAFYSAFDGDGQ
jgi:hypothetical protein